MRQHVRWLITCVALWLVTLVGLSAHDDTPKPVIAMTIAPQGNTMSVAAHIPIVALMDANLPRHDDRSLDTTNIGPALLAIGRDLAARLAFAQGGEPLPFPNAAATLSADAKAVDVTLGYVIQADDAPLSAYLQAARSLPDAVPTVATFRTATATREFTAGNLSAELVTFNPTLTQTMREFVGRGARFLTLEWTLVLFLLVMAATLPGAALSWRALYVVMGTQFVAALTVAFVAASVTTAPAWAPMLGVAGASLIVITTLVGIAGQAERWIAMLAAASGLVAGALTGLWFQTQAAHAGDHRIAAIAVFLVTLVLAQVWLAVAFATVRDLLVRAGLPIRAVALAALVYACHRALHIATADLDALSIQTTWTADHLAMLLVALWMLVVFVFSLVRGDRARSVAA